MPQLLTQPEKFRDFCQEQIERLGGAFPEYRFIREGGVSELVNWLEAKAEGSEERAENFITEICEFEEMPGIATMNAVWLRLFPPPVKHAPLECEHCQGTGWEIVRRGDVEGVKRCRCGGMPRGAEAA
jgi:hypothetical protein